MRRGRERERERKVKINTFGSVAKAAHARTLPTTLTAITHCNLHLFHCIVYMKDATKTSTYYTLVL